MGFFSKLKKVFNPGGVIVSKVVNDGNDYKGVVDYAMNGSKNAKKAADAQKAGQQTLYGRPVVDPNMSFSPIKLGWTNGGYKYHNASPMNIPEQPMSFGGGNAQMGMSGPQQMLQSPQTGGMVPPAGAQPSGPPTMQIPQNPQRMQAAMLRQGHM